MAKNPASSSSVSLAVQQAQNTWGSATSRLSRRCRVALRRGSQARNSLRLEVAPQNIAMRCPRKLPWQWGSQSSRSPAPRPQAQPRDPFCCQKPKDACLTGASVAKLNPAQLSLSAYQPACTGAEQAVNHAQTPDWCKFQQASQVQRRAKQLRGALFAVQISTFVAICPLTLVTLVIAAQDGAYRPFLVILFETPSAPDEPFICHLP
eukprot:CAMPEP_0170602262 /NCGR_PEP_ID=MMETSP0224-20130122/18297_1 /TAXON_ID=285029 /ORGANISM="Togula jolla, Strain CCCM 725" /LENGTH=206 /DNA_ID=CAMNT_0010927089 /DNA_START=129 /DNA_END=751 /DNA_ORIENTATION=-